MKTVKRIVFILILLCSVGALARGENAYAKANDALQIYPKNINKNNKKKVGKYYFWGDSKKNLYFSKYKSGKKAVKISKKVTTAVTDGKIVLYSKGNATNKIHYYRLSTKKKKTFTIKPSKKLNEVTFLNLYGNNLYFCADVDDGDGIIFPYYKFNIKTKKLKRLKSISKDASSSSAGMTNGRYFLYVVTEIATNEEGEYDYLQSYLYDCKTGKKIRCKDPGSGFFYNGKLFLMVTGEKSTILNKYSLPSQKRTKVKTIQGSVDYFAPIYQGKLFFCVDSEKYYKMDLKTKKIYKTTEKALRKAW